MHTGSQPIGTPGPSLGRRRFWVAAATVVAGALLVATLRPQPPAAAPPGWWQLAGGELGLAGAIGNVLLFLPFGVALGAAQGRARPALAGALILSACIEVVQGFFVPGREASLGDLLANGLGGAIGGWAATHAGLLLSPSRAQAWRLAVVSFGVAGTVLFASDWLMGPGAPSARYEGQFAQHWYSHRGLGIGVVRAELNDSAYAWEALPNAAPVNRALEQGRLKLEVAIVPGAPLEGRSRLAAVIAAAEGHESLARLEADGRDLLFTTRTRASRWGLRDPWVRLGNALPARGPDARAAPSADWSAPLVTGRDTIELGGARTGDQLAVWARGRTGGDSAAIRLGATRGWMLLVPASIVPRRADAWLSRIWLLALLLPSAWWLLRAVVPGTSAPGTSAA